MAEPNTGSSDKRANIFRFNLVGLIVFSLSLMVASAYVTVTLSQSAAKARTTSESDLLGIGQSNTDRYTNQGPWGELRTQRIKLQRPIEYFAAETQEPPPELWKFSGLNFAGVKQLLQANGLTGPQVEAVLAGGNKGSETNVMVQPDESFLLSLPAPARAKLYAGLYGKGINVYIDYPFIFPDDAIQSIYSDPTLPPEDVALLKRLVYQESATTRLTDYELLLRQLPNGTRRLNMAKALSIQPAVLAGLSIRPDTDIDKVANYWGRMENVRFNDLRPMLEALKRLPQGGNLSLMYLLPPFAREHLYTYPLPPGAGDPIMDCHWSTFNFANRDTDNRFNNADFTLAFIKTNYYRVEAPRVYGDLVLFVNERSQIKHSAVYLADDLAFTKYGDNHRQPWLIVRLSDMQAMYPAFKPVYFRKKTD